MPMTFTTTIGDAIIFRAHLPQILCAAKAAGRHLAHWDHPNDGQLSVIRYCATAEEHDNTMVRAYLGLPLPCRADVDLTARPGRHGRPGRRAKSRVVSRERRPAAAVTRP